MRPPTQLDTPCVLWTGCTNPDGYGLVRRGGRTLRVHRLVWTEANGPIPEGLHVLHRCDNPACIRPDHLRLGTNADNVADRVAKSRSGGGPGYAAVNAAKTHCPQGHPYDEENTYVNKGKRNCRICTADRRRRHRESCQALREEA